MSQLRDIPEVAALRSGGSLVRIPPELDVPLTDRVRQIVDTPEFRRLGQISQLGLVGLVYPAASTAAMTFCDRPYCEKGMKPRQNRPRTWPRRLANDRE